MTDCENCRKWKKELKKITDGFETLDGLKEENRKMKEENKGLKREREQIFIDVENYMSVESYEYGNCKEWIELKKKYLRG